MGLSQDALAKRAGCGQSTVASIENGRNKGATPLPMLAHVLGVEALWLVEGKGPQRRENFRAYRDEVEKSLSAQVTTFSSGDQEIAEVVRMMRAMNGAGKQRVVDFAMGVSEILQADRKESRCPVINFAEYRNIRMRQP